MAQKRVLLIGIDPTLVSFRPGSERSADRRLLCQVWHAGL